MKGMVVKIAGQKVFVCPKHVHIHIKEPWWGAWVKFNWEADTPGIGISEDLLKYASANKRKLKLTYYKNRSFKYLITPRQFMLTATACGGEYIARNKTKLYVIPVTAFEKETFELEPPPPDNATYVKSRIKLKQLLEEKLRSLRSRSHHL